MTAIASLSDGINRQTGGSSGTPEAIYMHKEARVAGAASSAAVAGQLISLFEHEGCPMSHGAVPAASFATPDNTTVGGMLQADPGGGRQKWLMSLFATANQPGMWMLIDRLATKSGMSGTVTTAQNFNGGSPGAPLRYTNGLGNIIFAEIYSQIGATATTITAAYADNNGSPSTTPPVVFGGTGRREAQRAVLLSAQAGDNGVQSITSCTVLASTLTAGNFGLVLAHVLAIAAVGQAGAGSTLTFLDGPVPEELTDACLSFLFLPGSAGGALSADFFASSVEA